MRATRLAGASAAALSLCLAIVSPVYAQTTATPVTTTPPTVPAKPAVDGAAPADADSQVVTIFGKRRTQQSEAERTRLSTTSANSCGFMNDYNSANDDVTQQYLQSFYGTDTTTSNLSVGIDSSDPNSAGNSVDSSDPNAAGSSFKDTAPFGDASQDNSANSNTLQGLQAPGLSVAAGACGPSDKAFAAGINYIARHDHTLTDAFKAFDAKDYPRALELFKIAYGKVKGNDEGAFMVGKMYLNGVGTKPDATQAIVWLRKVAEAKFVVGQDEMKFDPADPLNMNTRVDATMTLARIYMVGFGVPKDARAARSWYAKADDFGYIPASHLMGQIYAGGYGGEKNAAKAFKAFKKAAEAGYGPSEYEVGVAYYAGMYGVTIDKKTGAQWLLEASKTGHADALYSVGRMYDLGETLPADPQKALVYYKEAALKSQPEAEEAMGTYFYTGEIVGKDLVMARKWFSEAARGGDADAMFNLGAMYALGEGGGKDVAVAYVWFKLAEASGLEKATAAANEIAAKLTPEERARAESVLHPAK